MSVQAFLTSWRQDSTRPSTTLPFGTALTAFSSSLGIYALARLFPAEPFLIFVGLAMIAVGLLFAAAETEGEALEVLARGEIHFVGQVVRIERHVLLQRLFRIPVIARCVVIADQLLAQSPNFKALFGALPPMTFSSFSRF